ncbi:MAG: hypothetical protein AB4080_10330 [Trichodesmium sp.]
MRIRRQETGDRRRGGAEARSQNFHKYNRERKYKNSPISPSPHLSISPFLHLSISPSLHLPISPSLHFSPLPYSPTLNL